MAAVDVRRMVGERLGMEMERQSLRPENVARETGLSLDVIEGYLKGLREIDFKELGPLCEALGQDVLWLVSPAWKPSKVHFRANFERRLRDEVLSAERALSLVADFLERPKRPTVSRLPDGDTDRAHLLMTLWERVAPLREAHPRVEDLYRAHRLPALPRTMELDGFLVSLDRWALVFARRGTYSGRVEFTLLHEFAHYAFHPEPEPDRRIEIGARDFYLDPVPRRALQEWVANKFAQLYLVPMTVMDEWGKAGRERATTEAARYAVEHGVSADVAANALWTLLDTGQQLWVLYEGHDTLLPLLEAAGGDLRGPFHVRGDRSHRGLPGRTGELSQAAPGGAQGRILGSALGRSHGRPFR